MESSRLRARGGGDPGPSPLLCSNIPLSLIAIFSKFVLSCCTILTICIFWNLHGFLDLLTEEDLFS